MPIYPGYYEHTPGGCFWRGPLNIRMANSKDFHRVKLGPQGYCWTIFLPFRRVREWGFKTDGGWVHNEKYLINKKHIQHDLD